MRAGQLRNLITIQRPNPTTDAKGNRTTVWETVATVRAAVWDVSGRDYYAAQAYQAQDTVTFGLRWRDDVSESCRIVFAGKAYRIDQINHLGYRHDFIQIKAKAASGKEA